MQFFKQLFLLANAVSAVNIVFYSNPNGCSGDNIACTNIDQNRCCSLSSGNARSAVGYQNLPPATVRTYGRGDGCNSLIRSDATTLNTFCVFSLPNQITGGQWAFRSRRRGVEQKNQDCARPDTAYVQGREFNLTTFDDKAFDDFIGYMKSVQPAVPKQFLDAEVKYSEGKTEESNK